MCFKCMQIERGSHPRALCSVPCALRSVPLALPWRTIAWGGGIAHLRGVLVVGGDCEGLREDDLRLYVSSPHKHS